MDLTPHDIRWILIGLFVLILSVSFHEFGHAIMADLLGDDTPRRQGRVTLNPISHIDPIGTLLLPLIGGAYAAQAGQGTRGGFGWGKPVQWQPHRVRRGVRMATAQILVSVAGPAMNLLLAVVLGIAHTILISQGVLSGHSEISQIFFYAVITNFVLMFFNLLPIPPLDGGHVAQQFVPYRHRSKFDEYAKYGPLIILPVAFIPQLAQVFVRPAQWCASHLYQVLFSLFG